MNKLFVISLILGFWFILPLPYMWMDYGGYSTKVIDKLEDKITDIQVQDMHTSENTSWDYELATFIRNVGNFLSMIWTIISMYFQILVIGFPNAPVLINYFLWLMRIISISTIYLMTRGD